ncbi:TetR/AcrR family transcriptional regulator [Cryobacterium sp. Hb1]|uniref:TetR/AcrR family transcriptional regulator n=1 Tax=Cryobacterium sp. Hb1 TaxID=1259147 RepID=UPI0010692533|nr:TetR family transcriptional regulator [Cryobacterium sp. Hb1]
MTDTPTPRTQVVLRSRTREGKHHETKLRVEQSAVSLVLEHGFDNVTVDMICSRSGISQRIFFNYFNTKNAAIIGTESPTIDEPRMMLSGLFDTGRPNCSRMPWWASHVSWPCNRFPLRPAGARLQQTLNLSSKPRPARARLTDKWLLPWPSRSTEPSSCSAAPLHRRTLVLPSLAVRPDAGVTARGRIPGATTSIEPPAAWLGAAGV